MFITAVQPPAFCHELPIYQSNISVLEPDTRAVTGVSLGCIEYALCVRVNTWVMSNMLYLNAQGFKLFVTGM